MPRDFNRYDRIASQIKKEVSKIFQFEVKDPFLKSQITITDCEVSKDYQHAKIYFSIFNMNSK